MSGASGDIQTILSDSRGLGSIAKCLLSLRGRLGSRRQNQTWACSPLLVQKGFEMNSVELFIAGGKSAGVFACGQCKVIHKTQADAEQCCDWKCSKCGAKTDRFSTQCSACWDVVRAEGHAKRLAAAELVTEYDGWICCDSGCGSQDGYFPSIEDYVDYIFDEGWGDPEFEDSPSELDEFSDSSEGICSALPHRAAPAFLPK